MAIVYVISHYMDQWPRIESTARSLVLSIPGATVRVITERLAYLGACSYFGVRLTLIA